MNKVSSGETKKPLHCMFCGKSQHEVRKLIAGPTVFICDECVELCMDIIGEENKSSLVKSRGGIPTLSLLKTRFERIDDGARQGSDAQQRLRTARRRTKGGHFPARMGSATASGGHLEMFLSERNFRPMARREFLDQSRVPRCVTAGRTLERRHCLPGLHQHRVEVTAASALPSDLHRQLDDRGGDL